MKLNLLLVMIVILSEELGVVELGVGKGWGQSPLYGASKPDFFHFRIFFKCVLFSRIPCGI